MDHIAFNIRENKIEGQVRKITLGCLRSNIFKNNINDLIILLKSLPLIETAQSCFIPTWNNNLFWMNNINWK